DPQQFPKPSRIPAHGADGGTGPVRRSAGGEPGLSQDPGSRSDGFSEVRAPVGKSSSGRKRCLNGTRALKVGLRVVGGYLCRLNSRTYQSRKMHTKKSQAVINWPYHF